MLVKLQQYAMCVKCCQQSDVCTVKVHNAVKDPEQWQRPETPHQQHATQLYGNLNEDFGSLLLLLFFCTKLFFLLLPPPPTLMGAGDREKRKGTRGNMLMLKDLFTGTPVFEQWHNPVCIIYHGLFVNYTHWMFTSGGRWGRAKLIAMDLLVSMPSF